MARKKSGDPPSRAARTPRTRSTGRRVAEKRVELKTAATEASVDAFLDAIADEGRRADCRTILGIMRTATRSAPVMWGPNIVGFGRTVLRYATGRTLDWFLVGFSPRKGDLSIYLHSAFPERAALLARLGKHRTGVACLYIKRLSDIDLAVLRDLVKASVAHSRANPPSPDGGC